MSEWSQEQQHIRYCDNKNLDDNSELYQQILQENIMVSVHELKLNRKWVMQEDNDFIFRNNLQCNRNTVRHYKRSVRNNGRRTFVKSQSLKVTIKSKKITTYIKCNLRRRQRFPCVQLRTGTKRVCFL